MTQFLNKDLLMDLPIQSDYFPFISVDNIFLSTSNANNLLKDFPVITKGGSFNVSSDKENSIDLLIQDFKSCEIKKILEAKFDVSLKESILIPTIRGYSRKKDGEIHSDSSTKILTILIYLNDKWDHPNGLLRLLKKKEDIEDYIIEIPATLGSMVAFKVTENCWHGYKNFVGKRQSIQINYVHKGSQRIHKMRHAISSFFKDL